MYWRPTEIGGQRHCAAFAIWIDRRVCDLGKRLLQILEQCLMLLAKYCQHSIETHRTEWLFFQLGHVLNENCTFKFPTMGLEQVVKCP